MDVFTGQTTAVVNDCYRENNMGVVFAPGNIRNNISVTLRTNLMSGIHKKFQVN